MSDYFCGVSQQAIARRRGVDQSTVSLYASRFRKSADEIGLAGAGKEFSVSNEVESLRCLSVELAKGKLTAEDALEGVKIMRRFIDMGVPVKRYTELVKLCQRVADPGFVEAALDMMKFRGKAGADYEQAVRHLKHVSEELASKKAALTKLLGEVDSTTRLLAERQEELRQVEAKLADTKRSIETGQKDLERRLARKRTETKLKEEELAELAKLKTIVARSGMTVPDMIRIAKEFTHE
jgi:hypothetical protein